MKIGILCAIDPQTSQVAWGGSPIDAYIRFLQRAAESFEYEGYLVANGQLPGSPEACDAYVITGSPRGVYDHDPWISALMAFIREGYEAGKKFAGICFGHQVLAQALGGQVRKSEKGWGLGLSRFELQGQAAWMDDQVEACTLYFAHQDQVIDLPQGARLLGGSDFCPVAMFEMDGRVLGLQGHPEFDSAIMRSILERAKEGDDEARKFVAESAVLASGDYAEHTDLMAQWIVNFLKS